MAPSRTKPSTLRLSEVARHVVIPEGIVTTGWPAVEAKGAELGIVFDSWQQGAGRIALGKRADGKYAATVGGITWSIPRQVGKTFLVAALLLILCVLFPGLKVIWTAHRTRTATNTFKSMQGMCRRKKIAPHVAHIRTANGEQEIAFRNGSVIMFGAREQGFGRGFDVVDIEVFDEAQILTEKALEDMIPATNQSQHPHGALLFFIGTPPRPVDPGEAFTLRRKRALAGEARDAVYIEFSADMDAHLDDREQWAKANPSFPHRTPLESMLRMRENLGSDEAWRREALGIWDDDDRSGAAFGPGNWPGCKVDARPAGVKVAAIGIAVSIDAEWGAVVAASEPDGDGVIHVKPLQHGRGSAWVPEAARAAAQRHGCEVVVDKMGPAAVLIPDLRGARVRLADTSNVLDACASIYDRVRSRKLTHADYPELNDAVAVAVKRDVRDRWAWGRKQSGADISTLEAATLAAWLAGQGKRQSVYETRGMELV